MHHRSYRHQTFDREELNMLQQTPEYKRLPLHRIHSRRLSTKDFDYSAPHTASHASRTAFTKTDPNVSLSNATLAPPTHGGMPYDGPQNHQLQPYPVELATTLWPPETTNYWFPNWKELFHGFLVVQNGQPGQALVADSEQRGGIVCYRQQKSDPPPECSSTQWLRLGSDDANTSIHDVSQSEHLPTCEQQHVQLTQASLPMPMSSHNVAHSLPMRQEQDRAQIGNTNKAFSSPNQAPGAITKLSIKSPSWLPQGWITEIHIRRTGTTAGTPDKYFKHLSSGRRFRSRKDVLHFTSTGKGRTRKQGRGERALTFSAGQSLMKTFAQRKLSILGGLKPSSESCAEKKLSTHAVNSLLPGLSQPRLNDDLGLPYMQSDSLCSSSKDSAKERSHKLPVKKKAKTSPSKIGEDKQASKLWQWLTKPVARDNGTPLNQEMLTLDFSNPGLEKKMTHTADQKSLNDFSLRNQTADRATQLSKEIQAAHDDVVQMSREMQATAEKLRREILVDVGSANDMQASKVTCVALENNLEAGKRSKASIEALSRSYVTSSLVDNTFCEATHNLPKTGQFSTSASCSTICGVSRSNNTSSICRELFQAATYMPEDCLFPLSVQQPTTWPKMMVLSEAQLATMVYTPTKNGTQKATRHGDAFDHAIQPVQKALKGCKHKPVVPTVHEPKQIEECVSAKGDVTQPAAWPEVPMVHAQNSSQMASLSLDSATVAAERSASANGDMIQPANKISDGTHTITSHVPGDNHCSKEPDKVAEANNAQAARRQTRSMGCSLPQIPVLLEKQAVPSHGLCSNATYKNNAVEAGKPEILIYETHLSGACSELGDGIQETGSRHGVKWQQTEEVLARRLRRKKFSAVLNPKLDLSRLSPSLTTRQRAKVVERMKTRHARELLASLGKQICRKAVRRKP